MRNHARETLACDFFVAVTVEFRLVYVFLALEIAEGLQYVAELVRNPGVERHALDLVDRVEGVAAGDLAVGLGIAHLRQCRMCALPGLDRRCLVHS